MHQNKVTAASGLYQPYHANFSLRTGCERPDVNEPGGLSSHSGVISGQHSTNRTSRTKINQLPARYRSRVATGRPHRPVNPNCFHSLSACRMEVTWRGTAFSSFLPLWRPVECQNALFPCDGDTPGKTRTRHTGPRFSQTPGKTEYAG